MLAGIALSVLPFLLGLTMWQSVAAQGGGGVPVAPPAAIGPNTQFSAGDSVQNTGLYYKLGQQLSAFTVCFWISMDTLTSPFNAVFTYSTPTTPDEMLWQFLGSTASYFTIHGQEYYTVGFTVTRHAWHHVCVSWSNANNQPYASIDGGKPHAMRKSVTSMTFPSGYTVPSGGDFIVGQQVTNGTVQGNTFNGAFLQTANLQGSLTNLRMWDSSLSAANQYKQMRCSAPAGNVIEWSTTQWRKIGAANVTTSTLGNKCSGASSGGTGIGGTGIGGTGGTGIGGTGIGGTGGTGIGGTGTGGTGTGAAPKHLTRYGDECTSACTKDNHNYYWCYIDGAAKSSWDYCSPAKGKTYNPDNPTCNQRSACSNVQANTYKWYSWCLAGYTWEYCGRVQ